MEAIDGVVGVECRAPKADALPTGSPSRSGKGSASKKVSHLLAEHLLNNRLQIGVFQRKWEGRNTNKTYENRSVRTGQGELANRRYESFLQCLLTEGLKCSQAKPYSAGKRAVKTTAKRTELPSVSPIAVFDQNDERKSA